MGRGGGGGGGVGREWTVSIALPGSIIANAQSAELQTYVVGQIARAASIYCVDEIVVFSDCGYGVSGTAERRAPVPTRPSIAADPDLFLARCLAYLETPQYLRKHLFPMHRDLKFAGLLNPLDAPHHLRADEVLRWRDGVVVRPNGEHASPELCSAEVDAGVVDGEADVMEGKREMSHLVDVGFAMLVKVPEAVPCGARVTVDLGDHDRISRALRRTGGTPTSRGSHQRGAGALSSRGVCTSDSPRQSGGFYWGYRVRVAGTLSSVFRGDTWESGYDVVLGTSETGVGVNAAEVSSRLSGFKRLLIVFGGVAGLEESAKWDTVLSKKGCGRVWPVGELFDAYVNTCPGQGSRTIRTEEAVLISLAALDPLIAAAQEGV